MEDKNAKQKEFWSGKGGDYWVVKQNEMDIMLNPLGEKALAKLDLKSNSKVLDIGCGCGATTLEIAKKVSDGTVTGLDISVPMLNQAKSEASIQGIPNVDFRVVDVQIEQLPSKEYDYVYSRFGVMFFEDPFEAFRNISSSVKEGGKLSFVCWQDPYLNPWQSLSIQVIRGYLDIPSPPPRSPGPFAFQEKDYVKDILEQSGFSYISLDDNQEDITMFAGKSLQEASEDYLAINPVVTEMLKDSPDSLKAKIVESLKEAFSEYHKGDGLLFPSATWIVSASK
jgi:ubiquinone/menaquinone biosynthesis C-methylase UbiE